MYHHDQDADTKENNGKNKDIKHARKDSGGNTKRYPKSLAEKDSHHDKDGDAAKSENPTKPINMMITEVTYYSIMLTGVLPYVCDWRHTIDNRKSTTFHPSVDA